MVVFGSGKKKPPGFAALAVFGIRFGLRLAVPLRQMAREKEEKAVKPAIHRIALGGIEARRASPWQQGRD